MIQNLILAPLIGAAILAGIAAFLWLLNWIGHWAERKGLPGALVVLGSLAWFICSLIAFAVLMAPSP